MKALRGRGPLLRACCMLGGLLAGIGSAGPATLAGEPSPRQRILLDTGWRFHRGDAEGIGSTLDYAVRPRSSQRMTLGHRNRYRVA